MPDVVSILWRLFSVEWQGVPVASLFVFAVGGLMYVAMSRSPTPSTPRALAVRRPGWIARRRARAGIRHRDDRVGVGYTSATRSVHLSGRELAHHGALFGGPGSEKNSHRALRHQPAP